MRPALNLTGKRLLNVVKMKLLILMVFNNITHRTEGQLRRGLTVRKTAQRVQVGGLQETRGQQLQVVVIQRAALPDGFEGR